MSNKVTKSRGMQRRLLTSKLQPPSQSQNMVARKRLLKWLEHGWHRKLAVLQAPAGYGKTTFLMQFRDLIIEKGVSTSWITLDDDDNDLSIFLSYVFASIKPSTFDPAGKENWQPHVTSALSAKAAISTLASYFSGASGQTTLILDDYHRIQSDQIHEFLDQLITYTPPSFRVIIASRNAPKLPLGKLRADNKLIEFSATDLQFNFDETALFLRGVPQVFLDDRSVEKLRQRTEGWAAALRLASLAMQNRADPMSVIEKFNGSNVTITDFFLEDVLSRLPQEYRDFLMKTSVLERMSASICDTILDRTDSQQILEQFERSGIFTIPLDEERQWYRYHQLFGEFLQKRLERTMPEEIPNLHQASTGWFLEEEMMQPAVEHALAAGDYALAAQIIEEDFLFDYLSFGRFTTFKRWMSMLPHDELSRRPLLRMMTVWSYVNDHKFTLARELLDAVKQSVTNSTETARLEFLEKKIPERLNLFAAVIATYETDIARLGEEVSKLDGNDIGDLPFGQVDFDSIHAYYRFVCGETDRATTEAYKALHRYQEINSFWGIVHARCTASMVMKSEGRLKAAHDNCQEAMATASEIFGKYSYMPAFPSAILGSIYFEWNDLEKAGHYLKNANSGGAELDSQGMPDQTVLGMITQAQLLAATGQSTESLALLDNAERLGHEASNIRLVISARVQRAHQLLRQGRIELAATAIGSVVGQLEDQAHRVPSSVWLVWEPVLLLKAQVLIAKDRAEDALKICNALIATAKEQGRQHSLVALLCGRALADGALGNHDAALEDIHESLALGRDQGAVRTYLDFGLPLAAILQRFLTDRPVSQNVPKTIISYAIKVTRALAESEQKSLGPKPMVGRDVPIEPLSARELEVMRQVARGRSSRRTGRELGITYETVKSHLKSIYQKLGTSNRTEAADRARKMGLI